MEENLKDIIAGRKTFFIAPDRSLFPENYLEEYLSSGYETYFIENDKICELEKKIDIIIGLFTDAILFFNIDAQVPSISWPSYIMGLQKKYAEKLLIGVIYLKRQTPEERQILERFYLLQAGIQGGCIQLEYRKKDNFGIIEKILFANQARGRRKNVRALCGSNCVISFIYKGVQFKGVVSDISLSHFSCIVKEVCTIEKGERLENVQLSIKGLLIHSDAIFAMSRDTGNGYLMIFGFLRKTGESGLDVLVQQLLVPKLYEMMLFNCMGILNKLFFTAGRLKKWDSNSLKSILQEI